MGNFHLYRCRAAKWVCLFVSAFFLVSGFGSCDRKPKVGAFDEKGTFGDTRSRDPLPGDLVAESIRQDSIREALKGPVLKNMTEQIESYRKQFKKNVYTGYFLTDFNDDAIPELWVKIGTHRDNSRLELYYPKEDGTLQKSSLQAEPGKYYLGDDYIIQVVGSTQGIFDINRITIRKGEMEVETIDQIDVGKNPNAKMPDIDEPSISDYTFRNLSPIREALK